MATGEKDRKRKANVPLIPEQEKKTTKQCSPKLSELYEAEEIKDSEESWKKGIVVKKYFRLSFSSRIEQIPNPDMVYGTILVDLISKHAPASLGHGEIRAGITLKNDKLYHPYGTNLVSLQNLSAHHFVSELMRLRQSNADIPPLARCQVCKF